MQQKPQQAVAYANLYVANDQDPNFLFQNNGEGHFLEVALISDVCYNDMGKEEAGMGTDFGDYNNDGWLDLTPRPAPKHSWKPKQLDTNPSC